MPFYDFKCGKCNEEFEIMAQLSQKENNLITCPICGSNELNTQYKGFNVITSKVKDVPSCPQMGSCGGCIQ